MASQIPEKKKEKSNTFLPHFCFIFPLLKYFFDFLFYLYMAKAHFCFVSLVYLFLRHFNILNLHSLDYIYLHSISESSDTCISESNGKRKHILLYKIQLNYLTTQGKN